MNIMWSTPWSGIPGSITVNNIHFNGNTSSNGISGIVIILGFQT